ncbi:MAG: hypothetical protein IJR79_02000 [Clostridia bacterium]|nr:hypothetical protein [Clostridia bacterium]
MTKNDLKQVYYLDKEIESWIDDMTYVKDGARKKQIEKRLSELKEKRQEVVNFILSIEDPQIRLIVKLRCFNLLSWNAVADRIGGMNSEYTVKKRFYRFLEKAGA